LGVAPNGYGGLILSCAQKAIFSSRRLEPATAQAGKPVPPFDCNLV
jgi:hypothetical protein